ncbi:MAG: class I SAM-dependent methyltransferase family protein [archaeon]
MRGLKVPLKDAEKAKQELIKSDALDHSHRLVREKDAIVFPVLKEIKGVGELVDMDFEPSRETAGTLRDALKGKLSPEEEERLKTAFDTVGRIAILEIDPLLVPKEKLIADALLSINPTITTVLKKAEKHSGTFRTQKLDYLAGEKTKKAVYRENDVMLYLDVEKVYFSPRLSTERKRVMQLVAKDEHVLVMFSGCGPYTCVISKNTEAAEVVGVEINPDGQKYAELNAKKNKLKNVTNHCGDVNDVVPTLGVFDRVLMPLPMDAEDFLDVALATTKPGGVIHFYDFLEEKDIPAAAIKKIESACEIAGRKPKILGHARCGQFSPYTFRICVDARID